MEKYIPLDGGYNVTYYPCLPGVVVGYRSDGNKKFWKVYHESSFKLIGMHRTYFNTKKQAIEAIKHITEKYKINWNLSEQELIQYVQNNNINSRDFIVELDKLCGNYLN